jgi:hypothetical protein
MNYIKAIINFFCCKNKNKKTEEEIIVSNIQSYGIY